MTTKSWNQLTEDLKAVAYVADKYVRKCPFRPPPLFPPLFDRQLQGFFVEKNAYVSTFPPIQNFF